LQELTTINTHKGLLKFCQLSFGIAAAYFSMYHWKCFTGAGKGVHLFGRDSHEWIYLAGELWELWESARKAGDCKSTKEREVLFS